jgi:hypothetical protein
LPNSDARIHSLNTAEIILARWGRPAIEPVPQGPTVMQILALSDEELGTIDLVRRALARWGTPANNTNEASQ